MAEETIHARSAEARERIVNRFCKLTALSALPSVLIYLYLKIYLLAIVCGIIGFLFVAFVYLNKKGLYSISKYAIVVTTNLGVIFFSMYLGYDSGIYLYLFAAPLLIYLLYDFSNKKLTISLLFLYLVTFMIIFLNQKPAFSIADKLMPGIIRFIYTFNFCSAFVLCFGLVTYFANNHEKYISGLIEHRQNLEQEVSLRNKSEELLKKSLSERELLLAEVHHRVKNNLAIISALINMQKDQLTDEKSSRIFEETRNRIYAMSLIHNLLYQNKSFSRIDFVQYVNRFCDNMAESFKTNTNITYEQEIENITLDIKTAIPLGLILNELITNSIKYAFNDEPEGKISVSLCKVENNQYRFQVSDSGVGINEDILNSEGNMGMEIVRSLVEQIDGTIEYRKDQGSHFIITLTVN